MEYETLESKKYPGEWLVEAIDHESDGEVYTTIFAHTDAERRAREYAEWMNAKKQGDD